MRTRLVQVPPELPHPEIEEKAAVFRRVEGELRDARADEARLTRKLQSIEHETRQRHVDAILAGKETPEDVRKVEKLRDDLKRVSERVAALSDALSRALSALIEVHATRKDAQADLAREIFEQKLAVYANLVEAMIQARQEVAHAQALVTWNATFPDRAKYTPNAEPPIRNQRDEHGNERPFGPIADALRADAAPPEPPPEPSPHRRDAWPEMGVVGVGGAG